MEEQFLVMEDVTKVYSNGIMANNKVCLSARRGEIHAICGENGAGKSTLVKMLFGAEQPDEGRIIIKGKPVQISSPTKAIELGIGMVHQHFMLVPSLSVAENVVLGIEPTRSLRFDKEKAVEMTEAASKKYNLPVDAHAKVEELPVGLKQKVEIIKALVKGAEILILDEPTAVLTPQESGELFEQLRYLREIGHTILFISHKLNEVKALCDRVTIIRRGRTVGVYAVKDVSEEDISRLMVGSDVQLTLEKSKCKPGEPVLEVRDLSMMRENGKRTLSHVSFCVREGEILGIAGIEGNGQRELVRAVTGFGRAAEGSVRILGTNIRGRSIRAIRDMGLAHIPEDRMTMGVAKNLSIQENMIADKFQKPQYTGKLLLKMKNIEQETDHWIQEYRVSCAGRTQAVGMLSGGNIQKVVVARELSSAPKLLICDQPTRGIDVGATEFIRQRLVQMRDGGHALLLISADLNEIMDLSDSLLVLYGGEITAYFPDIGGLTEEELGLYMLGVKRMTAEEIGGAANG